MGKRREACGEWLSLTFKAAEAVSVLLLIITFHTPFATSTGVARHQDVALETTFKLAERLGSRMRTIYNSKGEIISAVSTISQEVDELKI